MLSNSSTVREEDRETEGRREGVGKEETDERCKDGGRWEENQG